MASNLGEGFTRHGFMTTRRSRAPASALAASPRGLAQMDQSERRQQMIRYAKGVAAHVREHGAMEHFRGLKDTEAPAPSGHVGEVARTQGSQ